MELDIKSAQQAAYIQKKVPATNEAPKISGERSREVAGNSPNGSNSVADVTEVSAVNAAFQQKVSSAYESRKNRMAIEEDVDKLVKQLMPDLGVRFKVHDSGQVITSVVNNDTKEVVREFPAEKILDIVYNMCSKLGIVVNKKM